jgi:dihydroorotase-like cyclic amidohydrolase
MSTNSIIETLLERGMTEPYHHAVSRPSIAEAEATVGPLSLAIKALTNLAVHNSIELFQWRN